MSEKYDSVNERTQEISEAMTLYILGVWQNAMGVDHGGQRGQAPQNLERGYANTNCPPPRFCQIGTKNERSVAFKIHQNSFSAGAPPRTPLGELTTLPQTP